MEKILLLSESPTLPADFLGGQNLLRSLSGRKDSQTSVMHGYIFDEHILSRTQANLRDKMSVTIYADDESVNCFVCLAADYL